MNPKLIPVIFLLAATLACQLTSAGPRSAQTPPPAVITLKPRATGSPVPTATQLPAGEAGTRVFETDALRVTIPAEWKTHEEVWETLMQADADYYRLGVTTLLTIQVPGGKGEGHAFFSLASSPLESGQDLTAKFDAAYANPQPGIEEAVRQPYERNGLSGLEITYRRPWGEPWWKFRDIWLEKRRDRLPALVPFIAQFV